MLINPKHVDVQRAAPEHSLHTTGNSTLFIAKEVRDVTWTFVTGSLSVERADLIEKELRIFCAGWFGENEC